MDKLSIKHFRFHLCCFVGTKTTFCRDWETQSNSFSHCHWLIHTTLNCKYASVCRSCPWERSRYLRVRIFSADKLSAEARAKRWDRVKVVCTQPFNARVKYGLSFFKLNEKEQGVGEALRQLLRDKMSCILTLGYCFLQFPLVYQPCCLAPCCQGKEE